MIIKKKKKKKKTRCKSPIIIIKHIIPISYKNILYH